MDNPATHQFVHLHLHSEYSLLDGGNVIKKLVERVKALGMSAVALTDHGNLHGAVEFYTAARAAGIKPILGIEAYVAPGARGDRTPSGIADGGFHLVLLAENLTGWKNLLKLSSDSFLNGFYYRPRMDKSTLAQWADGLIAINGHLGSSLAHHLLLFEQTKNPAHYQAALAEARWHAETFGTSSTGEPRFYIELQRNGVAEQESINPHLVRLARELNLPLVADNDAHFLLADDHDVHDSLCCISMGKLKQEEKRLRYSRELYVKSPQQMAELFADVPEAIENSARIADRCDVKLDFSTSYTPMVRVVHPGSRAQYDGGDATQWFYDYCARFQLLPYDARGADVAAEEIRRECDCALRDLCEAGLIWRYGTDGATGAIRSRLDRELQVLADKNICAYFLIVWDFVNWARQQGIPAGARGSGVGTMVGYVLGLSNACPERYGLLFERFTDPDRSEYPDIDIDICQDGRAAVLHYVRQKYGHVAQIITFGRLKAKAAIKDVARIMGLTPGEGQRLANLVPSELHITIDEAVSKEPDLKKEYESNATTRQIIDTARALEDHARHAGVHAAGVVIATEPLDNIVPLCKTSGGGAEDVVTQWDGPTCEQVGLLKMDFLGLRTLSTIELAKKLIKNSLPDDAVWRAVGRGANDGGAHPLDLDRLHYDDSRVLQLFTRGDTAGVFQFESPGMRKLLVEMQPDRLEDLIAANALYRPGPMDLIPDYNMRKHGRQKSPKSHPIVEQYTAETYGIMVYQEQVMQIVHGLGDIPLRAAYTLIKAISKKKSSVIDAERPKFIDGAKQKGLSAQQANELFDLILKFAGYGFNKSHSTGYAIIAYQTAYLKTYFPNHYMAAVLTYESGARKIEEWVPYLEDCQKTVFPDHTDQSPHIGVDVRPPDINLSDADFSVVYMPDEPRTTCRGHVRFGLNAIKGVGGAAIRSIIAEREKGGAFESIFDFCERVDLRSVNKATIESLVKCGAFDSLHGNEQRAAVTAAIEPAIAAGQSAAEDRRSGQLSIFGALSDAPAAPRVAPRSLPAIEAWDRLKTLALEKEALGFHISGHPLDRYDHTLREFCAPLAALKALAADSIVAVGGMLTRIRPTFVRNGQSAGARMAMITIQDKTGSADGVAFSDSFAHCGHLLQPDALVVLVGRVDRRNAEPGIVIDQVLPIDEAEAQLAGHIELTIRAGSDDALMEGRLQQLRSLLQRPAADVNGARRVELRLHLQIDLQQVTIKPRSIRTFADAQTLAALRELFGPHSIRVARGQINLRAKPAAPAWKSRARAEQPVAAG